ncbi:MAG: C4-type zinc ribbon domain-containing protein [Aquiluna sp.]|jgi:predicted  nucleic acid-binding Zn-ribbon protein|nr:C4-type zinc ribbon domain-containing protein [Aquiluna sp.]|tara:strand:+ start:911 stop:1627 length:717 start_codon:yes stop_codon:yes gene_type:complete
MKIDPRQLPVLMIFNQQVFQIRKLEAQAEKIAAGEESESIREALLLLSSQASQMLSNHEEIERDLRRSEADLELVEARIARDEQRLTQSADARTITGIQHELVTLGKRKGELEEAQLLQMERVEDSKAVQNETQLGREALQEDLKMATDDANRSLARVTLELSGLRGLTEKNRSSIDSALVELFERLSKRGSAIGSLRGSTCGACNMNLTSTALGAIRAIAHDELATCPECSAILVRE